MCWIGILVCFIPGYCGEDKQCQEEFTGFKETATLRGRDNVFGVEELASAEETVEIKNIE